MSKTITIGQIASKELFLDKSTNKVWMVSGFSDCLEQDWYNLYDYEHLQQTGELVPIQDAALQCQIVYNFEDHPESMASLQNLHTYLVTHSFERV